MLTRLWYQANMTYICMVYFVFINLTFEISIFFYQLYVWLCVGIKEVTKWKKLNGYALNKESLFLSRCIYWVAFNRKVSTVMIESEWTNKICQFSSRFEVFFKKSLNPIAAKWTINALWTISLKTLGYLKKITRCGQVFFFNKWKLKTSKTSFFI